MKIRDRKKKCQVEVCNHECLSLKCYWPRPDPGVFTQGEGYRTREGGSRGWLCGTREAYGCPIHKIKQEAAL